MSMLKAEQTARYSQRIKPCHNLDRYADHCHLGFARTQSAIRSIPLTVRGRRIVHLPAARNTIGTPIKLSRYNNQQQTHKHRKNQIQMPKAYETNSLGYKLRFNGPSTVEEYDTAAGRKDATLEDACDNTIYRGTLPEWQAAWAKRLEELTGVKRGVDKAATDRAKARSKKPEEVADIPEKVKAYDARVKSSMSDADRNALATSAQEVADGIIIDPSPAKRQAGPDKQVLAKADSLLQLPEDQLQAKIDKYIAAVGGEVDTDDETGKPDRVSLARLINRYVDWQLEQA